MSSSNALYMKETLILVQQISVGAESDDLQDIMTWILDIRIHRYNRGAGCVNNCIVPRANQHRAFPQRNELLDEFDT